MIKSVLITLVCMVIVCFFVITNAKYTLIAVLSVFSTSYCKLKLNFFCNKFNLTN